MKILIIWNNIPFPYNISTAKPFYLLKHSADYNYDITGVSFRISVEEPNCKYERDLQRYCDRFKVVDVSKERTSSIERRLIYTLRNRFSFQNIFSRDWYFFNHIYFPEMRKEIANLLKPNEFDIIYLHRSMIYYMPKNTKTPIILDFEDPLLYPYYQLYLQEKKFSKRLLSLYHYYILKLFIVPKYKKFDAGVYVSSVHKELLKPYLPKRTFIVPDGIDIEDFMPVCAHIDFPSLVFIGDMSYPFNVVSILYFYSRMYHMIRKEVSNVRLYIVGRNPSKEVKQLALRDGSIIVTGKVKDIKPYINRASIAIAPMNVDDGGFKLKILEPMAMGKAVVSTSIGARGLNVTPGENIIIADDPEEFARRVIELLNDEQLRKRIGANARKLVEEEYSWEKVTDMLNEVFQKVVNER